MGWKNGFTHKILYVFADSTLLPPKSHGGILQRLERYEVKLNHSAETFLRQDQADQRRAYWEYGQDELRG